MNLRPIVLSHSTTSRLNTQRTMLSGPPRTHLFPKIDTMTCIAPAQRHNSSGRNVHKVQEKENLDDRRTRSKERARSSWGLGARLVGEAGLDTVPTATAIDLAPTATRCGCQRGDRYHHRGAQVPASHPSRFTAGPRRSCFWYRRYT